MAKKPAAPIRKLKDGGKVLKAKRTPDGGQQYTRSLEAAQNADDAYRKRAKEKTANPKTAKLLGEARAYAVAPKGGPLVKAYGEGNKRLVEGFNQIKRDRGDKTRR
jgi:hypothetical protein